MKIEIELDVLQQILDALCYAHATNRYESERQARAIASIRAALLAPVVEPVGYVRMLNGEPTPDDDGCVFSYGKNPYRGTYGDEEWVPVSLASPPPPADLPLLTDNEINVALHVALPSLSYASEAAFVQGGSIWRTSRATESGDQMNDTVTRLMELADDYADWAMAKGQEHPAYLQTRQALQDELTKLFTPLSDEQIATVYYGAIGQSLRPHDNNLARKFARAIEQLVRQKVGIK